MFCDRKCSLRLSICTIKSSDNPQCQCHLCYNQNLSKFCLLIKSNKIIPQDKHLCPFFLNPDSDVPGDFTTRLWKRTVATFVYYVCGHCFLLTQKSPLQQTFTLLFVIWIFLYQLFVMTCILRIQENNTYITQNFKR